MASGVWRVQDLRQSPQAFLVAIKLYHTVSRELSLLKLDSTSVLPRPSVAAMGHHWWFNVQRFLLLAFANLCMLWLLLWLFFQTTGWYYAEGGGMEKYRKALARARYNHARESPSEGAIFDGDVSSCHAYFSSGLLLALEF